MEVYNHENYRSVGQDICQRLEPSNCRYQHKRYRVYAEIEAKGRLALWDAKRLETYLERIDEARQSTNIKSYYTQTEDKIVVHVLGFEIADKAHYKKCIDILDDIIALLKAA